MRKIKLKRPLIPILSPQNACRIPYEGFIDSERIGILYYNPITKELFPESMAFLKELGFDDFIIEEESID